MKFFALLFTVLMFAAPVQAATSETAIFAGGCFWCMHAAFQELPGVSKVTSGYTGGTVANPTYEQVSSGTTGHVEAIQVTYDPDKLTYIKLLEWFWDNVDPTDAQGNSATKAANTAPGFSIPPLRNSKKPSNPRR